MPDEPLRQLAINHSMTKPILIMGCERGLFGASALFCGYIGFNVGLARGKFLILFAAIAAWLAISFGLRLMGKADPYMNEVFRRATTYSDKPFQIQFRIPARSSLGAQTKTKLAQKRWM
jgi:type IV secretory pathway TrbD component